MADTFQKLWGSLLLHCPFVPVPLAQQWVNERYRQLIDASGSWGGQVASGQFIIPDAVTTGTVDVTNGSASVVGTGTAWTSALEGRQLYLGGQGPYYTILTVVDATHLTLDMAYGGTTLTGTTYEIALVYVTPPSDFLYFKSIKDPVNNWRLKFNKSQEWLDRVDASRVTTGTAWYFVDYRLSTAGIPRYEVWPRVVTQALYPFLYLRRPPDFSSPTDTPMPPIRGDEILKGALADLAKWPGTENRKNPSFNLQLASAYEKEFQELVQRIQRIDQEMYLSDYIAPGDSWGTGLSDFPMSASFFQDHDVF